MRRKTLWMNVSLEISSWLQCHNPKRLLPCNYALYFLALTLLLNDACLSPHTQRSSRAFRRLGATGSPSGSLHGRLWALMDPWGFMLAQPAYIIFMYILTCQAQLILTRTAMLTSWHKTARQFLSVCAPFSNSFSAAEYPCLNLE